MTFASDDLASDDVSSGALLQTRYFRRSSSNAFLQMLSSDALSFKLIPLFFNLFHQNLYE